MKFNNLRSRIFRQIWLVLIYGILFAHGDGAAQAAPIDLSVNVAITTPTPGMTVFEPVLNVTGTASPGVTNVYYMLLNGSSTFQPATTTNGWASWSARVTPANGANTLTAFAVNSAGHLSPAASVSFVYVEKTVLILNVTGHGTVSPDYNGAALWIGQKFSLTATPTAGFAFTNWTTINEGPQPFAVLSNGPAPGSIVLTNGRTLTFIMASNLVFTANFVDVAPPTLTVTSTNQSVTNARFLFFGTARDNMAVTNVFYSINGSSWQPAETGNNWTNWWEELTLAGGTNTIRACAVDSSGNLSSTSQVTVVYSVTAPLLVLINQPGWGSVCPNYNGALLQVGENYSMTAQPAPGFAFTNWFLLNGLSLGMPVALTNGPTLDFMMPSPLSPIGEFVPRLGYQANFVDIQKPVITITSPTLNENFITNMILIRGTASDNVAVANVFYQVNGGRPFFAVGRTNWLVEASLSPGTNIITAYAVDTAGNVSLTNTVSCYYVDRASVTVTISGGGTVSPNYNGLPLQIDQSYTMTAHPAAGFAFTNWTMLDFPPVIGPTPILERATNIVLTATVGTAGSAIDPEPLGLTESPIIPYPFPPVPSPTVGDSPILGIPPPPISPIIPLTPITNFPPPYFPPPFFGEVLTNNPTVKFYLTPGLQLQANFVDITPPTVTITTPSPNSVLNTNTLTITGTAIDNVQVAGVYFQLNGGGWYSAFTTNDWTNWYVVGFSLPVGTNTVQVYAVDMAGNVSSNQAVSFVNLGPNYALNSLTGMGARTLIWGLISGPLPYEAVWGFGTNTFNKNTIPQAGFSAGNFTYSKLSGTQALLILSNSAPPSASVDAVNLTFLAPDEARYTNEISGESGTFLFYQLPALAPGDLVGQTLLMISTNALASTVSFGACKLNFTGVSSNSESYPYSLQPYSALAELVTVGDPNRGTNYDLLVYSTTNYGCYYSSSFAVDGTLQSSDAGYFAVESAPSTVPASLAGLEALVTFDDGSMSELGFNATTYSLSGINGSTNSSAGSYAFSAVTESNALLTLTPAWPLADTNELESVLVNFVASDFGLFTNQLDAPGTVGFIRFCLAPGFAPDSLAGETLFIFPDSFTFNANGTYTEVNETNLEIAASGTYTYTTNSPIAATVKLTCSSPAGDAGNLLYLQAAFLEINLGTYNSTFFDNAGDPPVVSSGSFTIY